MSTKDEEKLQYDEYDVSYASGNQDGAVTAVEGERELQDKSKLHQYLAKIFSTNVEARGIERVPEDERDSTHKIGLLLMWWSVNMVVSTVPVGVSLELDGYR